MMKWREGLPKPQWGEGRRKNYECRNAEQRHPKPGTGQMQARGLRWALYCSSTGPLLVLYWSSTDDRVLRPGFWRPCGVSTAALPGFDRDGLAFIQLRSQFP